MLKVSENILIRSVDEKTLIAIQSKGLFDYRETFEVENDEKVNFCISTDKFLVIYSEGILGIVQEQTTVTFETKGGDYRLPILRERGLFKVEPEVAFPEGGLELVKSWEYDFSGKTINTAMNSTFVSSASGLVLIGENVIARNINNILEIYGDSLTGVACITPDQYAIIQRIGKVTVSLYKPGVLVFVGGNQEVRVRKVMEALDVAAVEKSLIAGPSLAKADFSSLKLKTLNKFTLGKVYLTFRTGAVVFISDSARKTLDNPELVMDKPLTLEVQSKDIKYLNGEISLYKMDKAGRVFYILRSIEKEKTVYIMVIEAKEALSW